MTSSAATTSTRPSSRKDVDGLWRRQSIVSHLLYWGLHAASLLVLYTGATAGWVALFFVMVFGRMLAITGGYHRYFAHRTYRTGRVFQLVLALLGTTAVQKGPLWWAAGHRRHHRYADSEGDLHSPRDGFWYAHQGWIFDERWGDTEVQRVRDLERYPELVWLNQWHVLPPLVLAVAIFAFGGLGAFVWGFALSTVVLWHLTYAINSVTHRWGRRRYDTPDDSRNNWLFGLLTLGEGWHNNHHHSMTSTRQGFFWWELDVTYWVLRALAAVGLVWDLREPSPEVLRGERRDARLTPTEA